MCLYEGCNANTGGKKKLYCGHRDDWGTCAYYRKKDMANAREKNKRKCGARKVYKKICIYCNLSLVTNVHNQRYHGSQKDKTSCAYLGLKKWQREYDAECRRKVDLKAGQ